MRATVCIPTYGRPDRLAACLAAVAALEPPEGGFDVVVADDGSPREHAIGAVVAAAADAAPVSMRLVTLDRNRGPGVARNVAWHEATGDWVAFTDDDCRPHPSWLRRLLEVADAEDAEVVQGRTVPDPERAHLLGRPFVRSLRVEAPSEYFQTCNIAYRRDLLERLGGFDATFHLSGEDTDLGWRAREGGARVTFAADAVVEHEVAERDWRAEIKGRRRWADVPFVVARHPGTRALAWKPVIYRRTHLVPLVLLASTPLLLGRRSRWAWLAAVAAVIAGDAAKAGSREAAAAALAVRAGDVYETVLVAAASARARTLLL